MNLRDLPKWAATAGRFRKWSGRDLHETVRLFTMSAADFLDEWFEDERVKGALATQAIIGAWCGPMTPGSAYVLMHHWIGEVDGHAGAWGWVEGRHGRDLGRDGPSRRGRGRRGPNRRRGRSGRDQRERPGGGGRARGRFAGPGAARRLVRAPDHHVPVADRRGAVAGRRRPRREAVPDAFGLGQAERRALRAAGVPVVGRGGRPAQGPGRRLALRRVPRTRVGRREVRPHERAPLRRGRVPDRARTRGARSRRAST